MSTPKEAIARGFPGGYVCLANPDTSQRWPSPRRSQGSPLFGTRLRFFR